MMPELRDLSNESRCLECGLTKLETRRPRGDQNYICHTYMSRGQTLLLLPSSDNKLQKSLAISSTPSSAKLGIGDNTFLFILIFIILLWK